MLSYTLFLVFSDGSQKEMVLEKPHNLVSNPVAAIVYDDAEGRTHNIPLSSLRDFYFHSENYNMCSRQQSKTLDLPTPGCECKECKRKTEIIRVTAKQLSKGETND